MDRRTFVCGSAAAAGIVPLRVRAQSRPTTARVAFLVSTPTPNEAVFVQAMRDLGYEPGRNLIIDRRSADGDFARLPALAAELVRSQPDVIAAFLTQASVAAKDATATIPIVMVAVSDPVASGLVANLARPGGNVTGTVGLVSMVVGKQLELIRELRPGAVRVATLWNPANAVFQQQSLAEARASAARLRMQLKLLSASSAAEIDSVLAEVVAARPDAVQVLSDPLFVANATHLGETMLRHRLLAVGGFRGYAAAGMVATYGPDLAESARRAASYVDRILRGAAPGELAVEQSSKFELVVNLKAAKSLSVAVPRSLLLRADEVIQ
jgi:putative tryptophan/tyrosine transport system substrate-binding protein